MLTLPSKEHFIASIGEHSSCFGLIAVWWLMVVGTLAGWDQVGMRVW
jgi:hypothetical protein